jgi:hypothetical protein
MGVISDDEFAAHINREGGGSRQLSTGRHITVGRHNQDRYSVALPRAEATYDLPVRAQDVADHKGRLLSDRKLREDPATLEGHWVATNRTPSQNVADASVMVPGRKLAVETGRAGRQDAVFDLGHGRDIYMDRREAVSAAEHKAKEKGTPHRVRGSRQTGYRVKAKKGTA